MSDDAFQILIACIEEYAQELEAERIAREQAETEDAQVAA